MKWTNLKSELKSISINGLYENHSAIEIINLLKLTKEQPAVLVTHSVKARILKHLESRDVELGGLLLGRVVSRVNLNKGIVAIAVDDIVESRDYSSTSVSLSMDSSVWNMATEKSSKTNFVVGWYHSHPNLGAFFSSTDRTTQKNFFNHPYSLGLVIDPIRKEQKIFIGRESIEVAPSHFLYGV